MPLTLMMADVNGLKSVNDAYGHQAGDLLLEKAAKILKMECRAGDVAARIGGDEFVLLLPECDAENADKMIQRINAALAKERINDMTISISIGYAVKSDLHIDVNEIFKVAENEMYRRKMADRQEGLVPLSRIRLVAMRTAMIEAAIFVWKKLIG